MNTSSTCPLAEQISQAIARNELALPTMPDWALRVLRMLDDINASAGQIVAAVGGDPAFAAQIIRVANSALYSGKPRVENVSAAISRVGFKMLRNLIISASMIKLGQFELPAIKKQLAAFWEHSHEVAAISYVLSKSQKHLNPDQAMLAGLTHAIGVLPLLLYVEKHARFVDEADLDIVIRKCGGNVGERLLKLWEFPAELTDIPLAHEDLYRETGNAGADYADIVTVANMLNRGGAKIADWDTIASVKRIGIHANLYRDFFERFANDLNAAREMLRPA